MNTETQDLIVIDQATAVEVFSTNGGLDPFIKRVKDFVAAEQFDMSTEKGRTHIRSVAKKIGSSKKALEEKALELTEQWRKNTSLVNAEKKRMAEEMDALRDSILKPVQEFEQRQKEKEQARVDGHKNVIEKMKSFAGFDDTLEDLKNQEDYLSSLKDYDFEEFKFQADNVFAEALKRIEDLRADIAAREAQRIENERLAAELENARLEAERKAQEEREKKIAADAKAKAEKEAAERLEAEKQRLEKERQDAIDAQRIAKEKHDAELARLAKEKQEADAKEAKRIADENKAESDRLAREADKEHRAKINNAAVDDLIKAGLTEDDAKMVIVSIAKGLVRNVKISY